MIWVVLGYIVAFVISVFVGTWIGRSWSSLPCFQAGEVVKFRAEGPVGAEYHMVITEVTHELNYGTTATLRPRAEVEMRNRKIT